MPTPPSYAPTFGGQPNLPANVSYAQYSFSSTLTSIALAWSTGLQNTATPAASIIDVVSSVNGSEMILPPGIQAAQGEAIIFNNFGASAYTVRDYSGNTVASVLAGASQLAWLVDNSFSSGTWRTLGYGAATTQAQASQLAGAGLRANAGLLDISWPSTPILSNYNVTSGDRGTVLEWQGGSGVYTFPGVASLGNNYAVAVKNAGTGNLTLTPTGCTIDGSPSVVIPQQGSCFVMCDGTNLITVGRGQVSTTNVTTLIKALPTSGNTFLSGAEINAQIQQFTGALAGASSVIYNAVPNEYFVYNATTGGQTLTFKSSSADTGVAISQGTHAILKNDGTTMYNAQTLAAGTVTQIATGSELTGGPITGSGTINLATVSGTPGTYDPATITVNQYGRTTSAGVSMRSLLVDSSRTVSAGAITFSGATVAGRPRSLTWSSIINIDFTSNNNFDIVAGSGNAQLTLSGTPPWGQGGVVSFQNNAAGDATVTFSPANTFFMAASLMPFALTPNPNVRDLVGYYVDSSLPPRVSLFPNQSQSSL